MKLASGFLYLRRKLRKAIVLCLSLLLMSVAAQSIRAAALSDLGAPQLFVRDKDGALFPALATQTHLDVVIRGTVARATLYQSFENQSEDWVNAVYTMPLPEQAAVHGWTVDFGDRRLMGLIKEREQAQRQYERAAAEGRRAGLMETIDGGLFQVRIANIDPKAAVVIEVEMTLPVEVDGHMLGFRFPTTLTPRYRQSPYPTSVAAAPDLAEEFWQGTLKDFQPAADLPPVPGFVMGEVAYPFTWSVRLEPMSRVTRLETPLHQTRFSRADGAFLIESGDSPADMDRDFWLRWELAATRNPLASVVVEEVDGQWFASLDLLEPKSDATSAAIPRDVILVLDVSGSMSGESIRQAKAAVRFAVEQLTPADSFNVIAFDHRVFPLFDTPRQALPEQVATALEFLEALEADGGTEMAPALDFALSQVLSGPGQFTQLLFLTDGAVDDEVALYQMIREGLGSARLSTVAIGPAPNGAFMRQAASAGRGLYRQISRIEDVKPVLERMVTSLSRPLLTNIAIEWPGVVSPARDLPPDLYQGEPIRDLVRFESAPRGSVVVSGLYNGRHWQQALPITKVQTGGGGVAAMWAAARIQDLLDDAILAGLRQEVVRQEVVDLGLEHHLVTPFTSLIAEELVRARPPSAQAGDFLLPNQLPITRFDFPQTATPASLWLYFGLLASFVGVLLIVISREEDCDARRGKQ